MIFRCVCVCVSFDISYLVVIFFSLVDLNVAYSLLVVVAAAAAAWAVVIDSRARIRCERRAVPLCACICYIH